MIALDDLRGGDNAFQDLAPDLTPMIDILFILLVFFMLAAGMVFQSLELELPSSVSEELPLMKAPAHIMLEIRRDGYALNGEKIGSFDALKAAVPKLVNAKPKHELVIASDKNVVIDRMLKVMAFLQTQNIQTANILMLDERQK